MEGRVPIVVDVDVVVVVVVVVVAIVLVVVAAIVEVVVAEVVLVVVVVVVVFVVLGFSANLPTTVVLEAAQLRFSSKQALNHHQEKEM